MTNEGVVYFDRETGKGHRTARSLIDAFIARFSKRVSAAVGKEVKLLYASQIATAPPTFAVVTSRPDAIPESYRRYLINGFRRAWKFGGVPLRLKLKRRRGDR